MVGRRRATANPAVPDGWPLCIRPLHVPHASRVLLNSGVPLVHIPCSNVAEQLRTTLAEIERFVAPQGPVGNYLCEIFRNYNLSGIGQSKVIWDLAAIGYLIQPDWVPTTLVHAPILTDAGTWSFDESRHWIRTAQTCQRDGIWGDFFSRLANAKPETRHLF
jgi:purine nucleosidase